MTAMRSLKPKLARDVARAVLEYGMIEQGDHVAVAVSGGKDSLTLLDLLMHLQRRAPVRFDLTAVTIDQGFDGFHWQAMEKHFQALGVPHRIERTHLDEVIEDHKTPGAVWCSLCARLRRGVLYRLAQENGWNKIALGHHADDLIETLLLSVFFNGCIQSMPPILRANDGVNVVIRPLSYVWEDRIIAYAKERRFPVICCACSACGDLTRKRRQVKALLGELEATHPRIKRSMLSALSRVRVTQLMDPRFLPLGKDATLRADIASRLPSDERIDDAAATKIPVAGGPEALPAILTIGSRSRRRRRSRGGSPYVGSGRLAPGKFSPRRRVTPGEHSPPAGGPSPEEASPERGEGPARHAGSCGAECMCGPLLPADPET
jgi:tRNA 2-thiocytidine biosynthesis protein TtcA